MRYDPRVVSHPVQLEDLLERRLPSAIARDDDALRAAGVSDAELRETKDAIAALGLLAPSRPGDGLRARLLASAARGGKYGRFADRIARLFDLDLATAEDLLARIEDDTTWMPFLVDGLELVPVPSGPRCEGAIATIVRFQPGTKFPAHVHAGEETMIVLDGGFREDVAHGEEVWRGDEIVRGDGSDHALVALPGVPCVAAVIIYGHTDFR